jgi:hypothetical protein
MGELTRDDVIEILHKCLEGQLKALRTLRKGTPGEKRRGPRGRKSNMSVVEDILKSAQGPLHVEQIIQTAQSRFHRALSRESLVSALTKKVLDENVFCRVDRNTFDLIERHKG